MIRRQNQQILLPHLFHQPAKARIEFLYFPGIALRISAMSPQSVKIHQIGKTKTVKFTSANLASLLHPVYGTVGMESPGNSFAGKDIVDFSNGYHIQTRFQKSV